MSKFYTGLLKHW